MNLIQFHGIQLVMYLYSLHVYSCEFYFLLCFLFNFQFIWRSINLDSRFILIYFPFRGTRVGASNKQCEFHQIKIVSQVHVLQRCGYGRFLHRRDQLCSRPGTEYEFISPTLWDRQKGLTKSPRKLWKTR